MNLNQNQTFIIGMVILVAFFAYIFASIFIGKVDQQVLSILAGMVGLVVGYYFGSSKSSAKKDETIAAMTTLPTGPDAPAP